MLKIHKKVGYALISLNYLKEKDSANLISSREIADRFHLPAEHVAKVLQAMGKQGILHAVHGPKGGYYLTADLNSLSFYDLSQAVLGEYGYSGCLHTESCGSMNECSVMGPVKKLGRRIQQILEDITVGELLGEESELKETLLCKE